MVRSMPQLQWLILVSLPLSLSTNGVSVAFLSLEYEKEVKVAVAAAINTESNLQRAMEVQDLVNRTTSILLGTEYSRSTLLTAETSDMCQSELLFHKENKTRNLLRILFQFSDFATKYDTTSRDPGSPMIYIHSTEPSRFTILMEAFPIVKSSGTTRQIEELQYHSLFESVIQRYTKSNQKPNQILRDTRSAAFCYCLNVKVEAVPHPSTRRPHRLILLREFLILQYLWESYRHEMMSNVCGMDQLIGFPMPFEFTNVVGSEYDFTEETRGATYLNVNGNQEAIVQAVIPSTVPNLSTRITSSLSYMSSEKLGPSLAYLGDLMRTQGKAFSVSSALKVYDQLICRLMVMHKYGVVHCDPNPTCLFLGPGESCNVVYISEFGSSVLKPDERALVPRFHDRFVSHLRFRERRCHYVHDLESAFYVFIYLLLGRLPWDNRMAGNNRRESFTATSFDEPTDTGYTDKTVTVDDKEKFWQSQDIFNRTIGLVELEFSESLYKSFTIDLIESLYSKTKEIVLACCHINPASYVKDVTVPGSRVYSIYYGLRRIIATYFRFETLNSTLKDTHGGSKIELLQKQCTRDSRIAWDLSHWCWNYLDPRIHQTQMKNKLPFKSSR